LRTLHNRNAWLGRSLAILAMGAVSAGAQQIYDPDAASGRDAAIRNTKPYQRWRFDYERHGRRHPYETSRRRAAALEVVEAERARHPEGSLTWQPLGPAPTTAFPVSSGRVSAVAVDPSNASHWLIGGAQGGIWETTDAGATWAPRTDGAPSLAMGAIAFAPGSPNVVYAGTGEAHFSGDSYGGAGVLKSTDGGTTWTSLAQDTFRGSTFSDIRVDDTDANVATAAVSFGVAGRYASYPPSLPPRGIFRTTNGGVTWSLTLVAEEASDLEVIPGFFAAQYAGVAYQQNFEPGGVFRSFDGGQTWALVPGPWPAEEVARVELAISPSTPNRLYVAINGALTGELLGVWVTDNAWATNPAWAPLPTPPCPNYQYWYDFEVSVDPQDPQRLFLGGVSICRWNGTAWASVSSAIHVDQHAMAWAGSRLIAGNDGGVYSTTNGGSTWVTHNTNLALTQFYDGVLHPTSASFALGGTQDNGTQKWTGVPAWPQIFGADGGDCEISASHPDQHWAVTTQVLGVYRTLNGGSMQFAGSGLSGYVPFIARLVKCPANDDVFVAGTNPLHRTSNFFGSAPPTWVQNSPPFAIGTVQSLDFAASDPTCGTYLAGTDDPELMLTTDGGATWRDIHVGPALPLRKYPVDIAIDPTNANVVYIALSGFDSTFDPPGHVFKTVNALSPNPTWASIGPPVDLPHNTVVVDPSRPNVVYVGTDLGVWRSTDAGGSWTPLQGLPNVAVFDLHVHGPTGSLVAFTHGRGAWRLPLATVGFASAASSAPEPSGAAAVAVQLETSVGVTPQPITVAFATQAGTAVAGTDFLPTSGTLTFPAGTPSGGTAFVVVPLVDDPSDEPDETFTIGLSSSGNAVLSAPTTHAVTIADEDPPPGVVALDAGVVEGSGGSSEATFTVSLSAPSGFPVTTTYATANGTATAGADYTAASGVLSFATGVRERTVAVAVNPDTVPEADETFAFQLSAPVNATLEDATGVATILDDDAPSLSSRALLRGSQVTSDLAATGPSPDLELFHLAQLPRSSYEVVVDAASGDVQPLDLDRVGADGTTVIQSAAAVGTGGAWSLRWENSLAQPVDVQYVRIRSGGCGSDCGADDRYRVRMYETTLAAPRFNNTAGQASVLILQNTTAAPVGGHQYFWSAGGALLLSRSFDLAPRSTQILGLSGLPPLAGAAGSLTVTHDGAYGALAGKVVSIEPATGLSFDTPLAVRR
jgi:photosystem II stability/assembly factor-like uncharacterized protein